MTYAEIHSRIQQDIPLVKNIYDTAREHGFSGYGDRKRYVGVAPFGEINLGIDFYDNHINISFGDILAKMRLLYDLSDGRCDLSSVYARLDHHLGILSEDVASGCGLFMDNTPRRHLDLGLLREAFCDVESELERTTFWAETGHRLRKPIIDLDHVIVQPTYRNFVEDCAFDYENDSRFHIKEP